MIAREFRDRAREAPEFFLEANLPNKGPLILDEVQKAPELFDAIKVNVDENRRPGRFVLSGSSQFSRKTGIHESLTGRIGILRMYPMTVAERTQRPFRSPFANMRPVSQSLSSAQEVQRAIDRGGMPGMCFLRSDEERNAAFAAWVDAICARDVREVDSSVAADDALGILEALAQSPVVSAAALSRKIGITSQQVRRTLSALETLFVVSRLDPHPLSVGKAQYYLCDAGLAAHLGAPFGIRVRLWILNEIRAQLEYTGAVHVRLRHYRTRRGSEIDFIVEHQGQTHAIDVSLQESPGTYTLRASEAFLEKLPDAKAWILAPCSTSMKITKRIGILPWKAMV